MDDAIHPNDHGYGVLAQEIYNRLALAPSLNWLINKINEHNLDLKQWVEHNDDQVHNK